MLHEAYDDEAFSQATTCEWLNVLKIEEIQQMTVSGLADLQLQDPNP
jgi:hypothetical protein